VWPNQRPSAVNTEDHRCRDLLIDAACGLAGLLFCYPSHRSRLSRSVYEHGSSSGQPCALGLFLNSSSESWRPSGTVVPFSGYRSSWNDRLVRLEGRTLRAASTRCALATRTVVNRTLMWLSVCRALGMRRAEVQQPSGARTLTIGLDAFNVLSRVNLGSCVGHCCEVMVGAMGFSPSEEAVWKEVPSGCGRQWQAGQIVTCV
jgi:hypothetical protein